MNNHNNVKNNNCYALASALDYVCKCFEHRVVIVCASCECVGVSFRYLTPSRALSRSRSLALFRSRSLFFLSRSLARSLARSLSVHTRTYAHPLHTHITTNTHIHR